MHVDFWDKNQWEKSMAHGGKRPGAGRPKKLAEPTERVRVPASMVDEIKRFTASKSFTLPVYSSRVSAGYPMPTEDHIEDRIDLMSFLGNDLDDAFVVYANGDSMKDAGIFDGDPLLVKPKKKPGHGKIVVAAVDGQVTVKFLIMKQGKAFLMPANPAYKEIPIDPEHGVVIWGVVDTWVRRHH